MMNLLPRLCLTSESERGEGMEREPAWRSGSRTRGVTEKKRGQRAHTETFNGVDGGNKLTKGRKS